LGYHTTSVGKQYLLFDSISSVNPEGAEVFKQDLRNVFQHGIVDYACIGEGIHTILNILEILKGKCSPHSVNGIAFQTNETIYASESERLSLDDYPFPQREEGFNPMSYYATGRDYPFLLLTTANGCRFSCEYCSTGSMNYPGIRFRSIEHVIQELSEIKDKFHPNWPVPKIMMNITDEDFAASPARVIRLCNAIVQAGLNQFFEFNSFLDNISIFGSHGEEMLGAMRRAGFVFSFIGIESTLDNALEGYNRPDQLSDRLLNIQLAIDKMASNGLLYFGDHMIGYPTHTIQDLELDYSNLFTLRRMHYAYFPILAPMPGTPLYWRVLTGELGEGFLPGVTYDHLDANHQVLLVPGSGNIKGIRDDAVQGFFSRAEYGQDAEEAIRKDPSLLSFFGKMLGKVSRDYPENTRLRELAEKFIQK